MFMFTFAAILDLAVSVPVVQPPPITDALPPGAVVRMGTARFFHFDPITWVGFASDGRTVLTAGSEYHIRFSDAATGRESTRFRSYTSPRAGFALSADGKRLALNQSDEMKILDVISRKEIRCFSQDELLGPKGERFFIHHFTLSPDGRFLAIWDEQPPNVSVPEEVKRFRRFSVDVWDVDTGRRVGAWKVGDLHEIEFTPDGKTLVAQEQTKEDRLRRWDIASGKEIRSLELPRQLVRYVFLPDGKTLVGMNTARNALHLHETATGRELRTVADAAGPIFAFALSADGANLAIARPGRLLVQRLADGKTTLDVPFPHHPVVDGYRHRTHADLLAFAPDGKTLAVAKGRSLEVWNLTTGTRVHPDDNMAGPVLAVHTHGRHLLARDMDLNLSLWDLRSGKLLRRFVRVASPGPEDGIQYSTAVFCFDWAGGCQEISADGRHVAALWFDGPIHLFDLASGVRIRSFEGSDKATCLAFSPNGKLLAGPSANGQIGIWNVTTGKLVQRLMPAVRPDNPDNAPAVLALHFSPDGRTLTAGACKEGDVCEVSCWELATGNLRSFLRPKGKSTRSG
ncbi:MAG: WD40 repeat domain-containing protein, partial [Planctomycetes bacterium]|nr:WD40 repeat domain-containing protein [Planctomycetota bacterium]